MPLNGNGKKCKAKAKSTGEQCLNSAVNGYDVCRLHGGKTPRGAASANYKGKGHTIHLPTRLIEDYQRSLNDPDLLSNRKDIALLETRIAELVKNIDASPIGDLWGDVIRVVRDIEVSLNSGNAVAALAFLAELGRVARAGTKDNAIWKEIRSVLQERSKLVAAENKQMNDAELTITVDRVMLLVAAIANVVMNNVSDNKTKNKITREIDVLISSGV